MHYNLDDWEKRVCVCFEGVHDNHQKGIGLCLLRNVPPSDPKEVVLRSTNCLSPSSFRPYLGSFTFLWTISLVVLSSPLLNHVIFKIKLKALTILTIRGSREILSALAEGDILGGPHPFPSPLSAFLPHFLYLSPLCLSQSAPHS